jgi:acetate kinase
LLGVSGISGDVRVLLASNDPHAREDEAANASGADHISAADSRIDVYDIATDEEEAIIAQHTQTVIHPTRPGLNTC